MDTRIRVVVCILYNNNKDKVLITKRISGKFLAGYWEFPGGKVKNNEDSFSALSREFDEELGIIIKTASRLVEINHDYPEEKVLLDVWKIHDWEGAPSNLENQEISWSAIRDLIDYKFPEANRHIIQTLYLPDIYAISRESYKDYPHLFSEIVNYFNSGLKIFQIRLGFERNDIFKKNIEKLHDEAKRNDAKLILNGIPSDIESYAVDGIHLKTKDLFKCSSRPISEDYILGASCHNEIELAQARRLRVNYAFLSPVLPTKSHPKAKSMGWNNFKTLVEQVNFPVYALGGISLSDLKKAKENGAYGIAMIRGMESFLSASETS